MITRIECATATIARFLPRRAAIRWYWADRYVALVRTAAHAASTRVAPNQGLACPVRPLWRLPALSLLPGHILAQDDKCFAEGKRLISRPTSANTCSMS